MSVGKGVSDALDAAERLDGEGISAEVVDLRTLRPLDLATVLESVARTNRILAVEEGPRTGGWAQGVLGAVAEEGLHELDDAWIVATAETPIPYSPTLEDAFLPDSDAIVDSIARGSAWALPRTEPKMAPTRRSDRRGLFDDLVRVALKEARLQHAGQTFDSGMQSKRNLRELRVEHEKP